MNKQNKQIIVDVMPNLMKEVSSIFEQIWLSPDEMEGKISKLLNESVGIKHQKVIVSGETKNLTLYVILEDKNILVFSPFQDLRDNILLNRWNPSWSQAMKIPINYFIFETDESLEKLLNMPTMMLINLCVVENYPIPRLNLSTGTLASYLRKQQMANVKIIDMQMRVTIDEIISQALELQPDLIGLSVNFGQKMVAFSLLDKLFHHKNKGELNSLIVVGNVIPAFSPEQFFEKYPDLLICYKEGEYTLRDLSMYLRGELKLSQINGIMYYDPETEKIKQNPAITVDMNEVPTPALDTIRDLAKFRGALTLETSRGCDYAQCTFCPRDHKLKSWRYLSAENTIKQINDLVHVGKVFDIKPHIYLADEEFIGELPNGKEAERIIKICEGIISKGDKIQFDLAARADSVYEPKRSIDWNVERLKMWHYCAKAGADRVFIGVESGSQQQLKRFGKGTTPEQNIIALRLLSALGIRLRIGFIMFDPLMKGLNDIKENLAFLERTDAIMHPIDIGDMSYKELYQRLLYDEEFINKHKTGKPVHSLVSYMLASMEVLMNTPYSRMVKLAEKEEGIKLIHNNGEPDTNMGRYSVGFIDPIVGELSLASQLWIDSNFSLMYTVKSLHKVAQPEEKKRLYDYMIRHRQISQYFLKYLIYGLDSNPEYKKSLKAYLKEEGLEEIMIESPFGENLRKDIISAMTKWQRLMAKLAMDIADDLENQRITDTVDARLEKTINKWFFNMGHWELINAPENMQR